MFNPQNHPEILPGEVFLCNSTIEEIEGRSLPVDGIPYRYLRRGWIVYDGDGKPKVFRYGEDGFNGKSCYPWFILKSELEERQKQANAEMIARRIKSKSNESFELLKEFVQFKRDYELINNGPMFAPLNFNEIFEHAKKLIQEIENS
jgi:hypothetical protein